MLTEEQVTELKRAHKQTREKRLADRIKAVLMLHVGFTYEQIKQALLLDEVTVGAMSSNSRRKALQDF